MKIKTAITIIFLMSVFASANAPALGEQIPIDRGYDLVYKGSSKSSMDWLVIEVNHSNLDKGWLLGTVEPKFVAAVHVKVQAKIKLGIIKITKTVLNKKYVKKFPLDPFILNHQPSKKYLVLRYHVQFLKFELRYYQQAVATFEVPVYLEKSIVELDKYSIPQEPAYGDIFMDKKGNFARYKFVTLPFMYDVQKKQLNYKPGDFIAVPKKGPAQKIKFLKTTWFKKTYQHKTKYKSIPIHSKFKVILQSREKTIIRYQNSLLYDSIAHVSLSKKVLDFYAYKQVYNPITGEWDDTLKGVRIPMVVGLKIDAQKW